MKHRCNVVMKVNPLFEDFIKSGKKKMDITGTAMTKKLAEKQVLIFTILVDEDIEKKVWDEIRKRQKGFNL